MEKSVRPLPMTLQGGSRTKTTIYHLVLMKKTAAATTSERAAPVATQKHTTKQHDRNDEINK